MLSLALSTAGICKQVGIFRKSGVKSRIQKLKEVIEESIGDITETFDLQQAYDIADMVKQYFRELPDTLLTTKMSDTFVAIFQRKQRMHFHKANHNSIRFQFSRFAGGRSTRRNTIGDSAAARRAS